MGLSEEILREKVKVNEIVENRQVMTAVRMAFVMAMYSSGVAPVLFCCCYCCCCC